MKSLAKWVSTLLVLVLLAAPAVAAQAVASGKVKSILSDKKEFVLTDSAGKDYTFNLGANVVINRGGKESQNDLKVGDGVNVMYDKGVITWTAEYILVQEGNAKNSELMCGTVKNYDADQKQLTFTDTNGKDWTFDLGDAKVCLNKEPSKIANLKIGDHALLLVDKVSDNKWSLKSVMVHRK